MNAFFRLHHRGGAHRRAVVRCSALVVVVAAVFGTVGIRAQAQPAEKAPPPIPDCFKTGSGYGLCNGMVIPGGGTIVKMEVANKKDTFLLTGPAPLQTTKSVACGDLGCVYNHLNWSLGPGVSPVLGCQPNQTTCDVTVAPGSTQWTAVYVRQNNDAPILWAIWNTGKKGGAVINGYIHDKQGNGFAGSTITAYSTSRRGSGVAVSGDQGFYSMEVEPGSYKIIPSGGVAGKKPAKYKSESEERTVAAGDKARADFTLESGLVVTLTLSRETTKANGTTVVDGFVETTEYGKPTGGVKVSLRPKAGVPEPQGVESGARATICGNAGIRIWPGGTLATPSGSPVDVVTTAAGTGVKNQLVGRYPFSITVGTVPGPFELTAWAEDSSGKLITKDVTDVSDEATLRLEPTGSLPPTHLFDEIRTLLGDKNVAAAVAGITNDPTSILDTLAKLSDTIPQFGGIGYTLANGAAGGGAVLVYPDTTAPKVNASGQITSSDGFVLSPGLWAGNAIGQFVQGTPLSNFIQKGQLSNLPTFPQWLAGAGVQGWNLQKNTATIVSQSFEYAGWPYPATQLQGAGGPCN